MLATVFSTFRVGLKFELTFVKCYSFVLVLSMKSLDRTVVQTDCAKVCVIFPGALGDFVCFLPALQALTKSAQVVLYCHSAFAEIAPCGVTVRSIESPEIGRLFVPGSGLDAAQKNYFRDYAAVYSWMGSQQPEFVTQLQAATGGRATLFPFRPNGEIMHQADYYRRCIAATLAGDGAPMITTRAEAILWQQDFWTKHSLSQRRILLLAPGSGARAKNWPEQFFVTVAQWWRWRVGGVVILLLGPVEQERGGVNELRQHGLIASGLSLSQVAALLAAGDVYLGNDSGITHLAAALGVPTVALFGPSDPRQWAPRGRQVAVVRRALDCSPCSNLTMAGCPHRACLTALDPEKPIAIVAQWMVDRERHYLDKIGVRD